MIVADAGPIIVFARIGRLDLLHRVVRELWISEAVYEELTTKGQGRAGAAKVEQLSWIRKQAVTDRTPLEKEEAEPSAAFRVQVTIATGNGSPFACHFGLQSS